MAEANLVAIVGVSAGALVALASPLITARATTRGQRRLFIHQRHLADRRELRELLDQAIETISVVQGAIGDLSLDYTLNLDSDGDRSAFGVAADTVHGLEMLCARVAIRLGEDAAAYRACQEVASCAVEFVSAHAAYIADPDHEPMPSREQAMAAIQEIQAITPVFLAAATALVGSELFEAEEDTGGTAQSSAPATATPPTGVAQVDS